MRNQLFDLGDTALDRLACSPARLHFEPDDQLALTKMLLAELRRPDILRKLVDLATEADHQHRPDIRMVDHAGNRPLKLPGILALRVAAALLMRNGDNTIDAVRLHRHMTQPLGDLDRHVARAVRSRDDRDIIARSDIAVFTQITIEGSRLFRRHKLRDRRLRRVLVILPAEIGYDILGMDPLSLPDVAGCLTDNLTIFPDPVPGRNRLEGDLLPRSDRLPYRYPVPPGQYLCPLRNRDTRNGHIVGRIENNYRLRLYLFSHSVDPLYSISI